MAEATVKTNVSQILAKAASRDRIRAATYAAIEVWPTDQGPPPSDTTTTTPPIKILTAAVTASRRPG